MTPYKSNGWTHGGRYVKPQISRDGGISTNTPRRLTNGTPTQPQRSNNANPFTIASLSKRAVNETNKILQWILPLVAVYIQTAVAYAMASFIFIVHCVSLLQRKAESNRKSKRRTSQKKDNSRSQSTRTRTTQTTTTPPAIQQTTRPSEPKSLLRRNSSTTTPSTRESLEPRSARRVLFSETSEGHVSRIEVLYDKELPASARKVPKQSSGVNDSGVGVSPVPNTSLDWSSEQNVQKEQVTRNQQYSPLLSGNNRASEQLPVANSQTYTSVVTNRNQQASPSINPRPNPPAPQPLPNIPTQYSPLATIQNLNKPTLPLTTIQNTTLNKPTKMDINQKRRNLIAVSGYQRPNRRTNANVKRQREVEEWVWREMNKKSRGLDARTPLKVRS